MSALIRAITSPIGKKILMALTGLGLIGFLVLHLAGNLLIFVGADAFNEYSHKLVSNPLIYVAEGGLLLVFIAHFFTAFDLTAKNRAARPIAYERKERAGHTSRKSLASTIMFIGGLTILVFVPLHLWTFKFGPHYELHGIRDLHRLTVEVFQKPGYVVWYVIALAFVGLHLWHGFSSAFQSMGADHPVYTPILRRLGQILAVAIAGGFILIPVILFATGG